MLTIPIVVRPDQPAATACLSKKTWFKIKTQMGGLPMFPPGDLVPVGNDPFRPSYTLVLGDQIEDGKFFVSPAIKERHYQDRDVLEF